MCFVCKSKIVIKSVLFQQQFNADYNQWNFECHHGPNECYGNKVQACAISKLDTMRPSENLGYNKVTVAFINCLMAQVKREPFDLPIREVCI